MRGHLAQKNGWWYAVLHTTVPYESKNGDPHKGGGERKRVHTKVVWKSAHTKNRREAEAFLNKLLSKESSNLANFSGRQTVGEYLEVWLQNQLDLSANTLAQRESLIQRHILPEIGHKRLSNLTAYDLNAMYRRLTNKDREDGKGKLSPRTVQICHSVMHKALKEAVEQEILSTNVAARAHPPRSESPEFVPLDEVELGTFFGTAERLNSRYRALYVLAVDTGLRLGELLGLRWSDVNLDEGTLSVRHTLLRKGHDIEARIKKTKTGSKGTRFLEIGETALIALREHRHRQIHERLSLGPKWEDHNLVFSNTKGKAVTDSQIRARDMARIIEAAGMRHFRPHDLRHTTATLLLSEGVPAKVIQERLGHTRIDTTMNIYGHVTRNMQHHAATKIDLAIKRSRGVSPRETAREKR